MVGYLSGKHGAILLTVPHENSALSSYNIISFIDQACQVKMAGYWPCSFLCVLMDLDSILVHKHAKKELG